MALRRQEAWSKKDVLEEKQGGLKKVREER